MTATAVVLFCLFFGRKMMNEKKFMTVYELAKRYNTSPYVGYEMISKGYFPKDVIFRLGRKILINRENLERFEANGGTAAKA